MSDTDQIADTAPAPVEADPKAEERALDAGLAVIAEGTSDKAYEDYKRERLDRISYAKGDGKLDEPDRKAARADRWAEIRELTSATAAASAALDDPEQAKEPQESPAQEWQRIQADADARDQVWAQSEAGSGFEELTAQAVELSGAHFTPLVHRIVTFSEVGSQFCHWVASEVVSGKQPDLIHRLNAASSWEVSQAITRFEGAWMNAEANRALKREQEKQSERRVSRAPKPVATVSGRSGAAGKDLDSMSYEEFKAHRMRSKR